MKRIVLVKVCDICIRDFKTLVKSQKYCSLECVNEKGRRYQSERSILLNQLKEENKELAEENKKLKKQLQEKEHD